jgi:raffinose/stachyose/melibiose transport system substrate-binding protein
MRFKHNHKLFIFLMLAVFLVLTACSGGSTPQNAAAPTQAPTTSAAPASAVPNKAAEPVKLKFLYIWPEYKTTMEKTIQMFEAKFPNIKVDVSVTPWDKVKAQLQTAIASNDAPDVSFMWPKDMAPFVSTGSALDLTPYMKEDPSWRSSFVDEAVLTAGIYDGKVYNSPFRGSTTYIAYNKDMFDQNGWTEPKNLAEFEALMDKMVAKKITPFAIAGKPDGFQITKVNEYLVGYETLAANILTDPAYVKARKVDVKGAYAAAFKRSKDWYSKGYYGESPIGIAREQAQALFFTGKSPMILLNNNELTSMRKGVDGKFNMKYMIFPAPEGAKDFFMPGGMDGYMVYGKTKHPKEAIELMKYLNSEEVQNLWAEETLSVMTRKGVTYKDPDMAFFAEYIKVAGKYTQFPDYNTGDVVTRNAQEFVNYLLSDAYTAEKLEQTWNDNFKKQIEASK